MPRIRSGYSFKTAYGHLDQLSSRLKEIGWSRQPLSDTLSTYGFNRWSKLVPNPMFGVELGVVPDNYDEARRPPIDYWTFFAIEKIGSIYDLVGLATDPSERGTREPSLTYEQALQANDVVKIAGNRLLLRETNPRTNNLYVALSPSIPIGLYRAAKEAKYKFIASSDNVYTRPDDREIYRMALWRHANTQTFPQYVMDDKEWAASMPWAAKEDLKMALKHRDQIFQTCIAKLEKATLFSPEKKKTLRQMCIEGAKKKGVNLKDKVYLARMDRELSMIAEKKFEDYFYIIADIVSWAKERMIVGPARGSSCGSLVCYLLDITAVDPIPYNLIFERFIDVTRSDLPDIDIDFSDTLRPKVFEYVEQKYGRDHVARLGTVGMFRPRSALNSAGMALRVPAWRLDKVLESLIIRSSGDSRALQQLEDTLKDTEAGKELAKDFPAIAMASKLEGHPSNSSQHAAGVVVTAEPIARYVAIDKRTFSAMCDKKDAEDLNLLKIDMLGLTQLSIFERTLELIGKPFKGFLESIPINDQKAFDVLNARHFSGVFQFNGMALQSLSKQIRFTDIEDIIAITALARPGPMASGGANRWVKRRIGEQEVEYPHKLFEQYLKETLGIVAYQEQVLRIGREIGDLSWEDVTQLRKSMSRSLGKEYFDQYGVRWKEGAAKKGIPKDVLDKMWDDLCAYGSWAFNRSHAVAYGLVSYYCCWFKAYYPVEFAAATLDAESMVGRQINILRELYYEGIHYKPVDPDHSELRWAIKRTGRGKKQQSTLVGPLTLIKGIGTVTATKIIASRKKGGKTITKTIRDRLVNAKTPLDSIFPVTDAVKALYPNLKAAKITTKPLQIINVQPNPKKRKSDDVLIIGVATKIAPKDENEAVNVAKRGGRELRGPTRALNLFIKDDSDEIFCKVNRFDFNELGLPILESGRVGKSIYAIKGSCPPDFRMIRITNIRYLGEIDDLDLGPEKGGRSDDNDNAGLPHSQAGED